MGYPNGVVTAYTYDPLNRLTNLGTTNPSSGVTVQSYAFTLGPSGNRTKITDADGTIHDYTYDDLYRLNSEKVTVGVLTQYQKNFTYDNVGNRKTQVTNGSGASGTPTAPGSIAYGYDDRDRLLAETLGANPPTGYAYDANGDLVTKDNDATYTWDLENRLVKVTKANGTIVENVHDADGVRLQTKTTPSGQPAQTTNYLVDTSGSLSQVVAEADAPGALKAYYVRGDELLAVMRPLVPTAVTAADWQTRFFHADGLGSIRRLTNDAGQITGGYSYTAFGELLAHTGQDPQAYAFAGEPYDPNSGFQYHRARWMDPRTGRFLGMDPLEGRTFDPATLHRYLYGRNDPGNRLDPSGKEDFSVASFSIAVGISAVLGGISSIQPDAPWNTFAQGAFKGAFLGAVSFVVFAGVATIAARGVGQLIRFFPSLWKAEQVIPEGFSTAKQFKTFAGALKSGLQDTGYADAEAAFQGSSVTGESFSGEAFDVGRVSDFDIALGSKTLLARARDLGVELRSLGTRTAPLTNEQIMKLGLGEMWSNLQLGAGRPVNFMIFESIEQALTKAPSITVPF